MVRMLLVALIPTFGASIGCGSKAQPATGAVATAVEASAGAASVPVVTPTSATRPLEPKAVDPKVVLHTSLGDITLQLFHEQAPRTVENFLRGYAERGYYDQTIFHHAEPGRMLIAGGYTAELARKPPRAPIYNESRNGLSNARGTVAMIREPDAPHSATAEFFINLADNADFDFHASADDDQFGYCVFGKVIGGLDIVDRIAQLETTTQGDFTKIPSPLATILSVERLQ
jgi:peptidyl-prolyl cis-trans isomerase A (cyclophilin A)